MYDHIHLSYTTDGGVTKEHIEIGITATNLEAYFLLKEHCALWDAYDAWVRPLAVDFGMPENAEIVQFYFAG